MNHWTLTLQESEVFVGQRLDVFKKIQFNHQLTVFFFQNLVYFLDSCIGLYTLVLFGQEFLKVLHKNGKLQMNSLYSW